MGTSFTMLRLFFTKSTLSVYFSRFCMRRCMPVEQIFAEGSELCMHAVFQLVVVHKTSPSEFILQDDENMKVGGC